MTEALEYRPFLPSSPSTFYDLNVQIQENLFSKYLNFTDLKNCRLVCKNWNSVISTSEALLSGYFYISLEKQNQSALKATIVPWQNVRLNLFDVTGSHVSDWDQSAVSIFADVKTLEFRQCFICWTTFQKYVTISPHLRNLSFNRCIFKDSPDLSMLAKDREIFLSRLSLVKVLTVADVTEIFGLIEILEKFVSYGSCNLETLKIEYHPCYVDVRPRDAVHFLQVVAELVTMSEATMKHLILNVRSTTILNYFGPFLLSRLEKLDNSIFQLQTFKLAQAFPGTENNVGIQMESGRFLVHFSDFLRTQRGLRSLAFPHLENLGVFESRRWNILDQTTKRLQKLRVPGAMYVRRNALKTFHSLKLFSIGEKSLGGPSSWLHPTKFNVDKGGVMRQNAARMREIFIFARIVYESGNLFHILEKFRYLTKFEVNCFRPLFNDKDMQAIIKYTPNLTQLAITHCDLLTDYGVTGIPASTCNDMLRYSTLYIDDIKVTKNKMATAGEPLSKLTGLVTLLLVGTSSFTDVGLKFGFEFQNLRKLHLPYGKGVTEWGIEQLGSQNPCIESLTLTGATPDTAVGMAKIAATHNRLVKKLCRVENIKDMDGEMLQPTLLHGILWNSYS